MLANLINSLVFKIPENRDVESTKKKVPVSTSTKFAKYGTLRTFHDKVRKVRKSTEFYCDFS